MREPYKSSLSVHFPLCPETFFRNAYHPVRTFYGYAYTLVYVLCCNPVCIGNFRRVHFNDIPVNRSPFFCHLTTNTVRPAAGTIGSIIRCINPQCEFAEPGLCSP